MPGLTYDPVIEGDVIILKTSGEKPIFVRLGDKMILEYCSDHPDPQCTATYLYNLELYENEAEKAFSRQVLSHQCPLRAMAPEEDMDGSDYILPYVWTKEGNRFSFFAGSCITMTAQEVESLEVGSPLLQ
jgi:hypothetical protein